MESPNHYELLGVTPDATAAEIRTSYRRLIRIYHPDVTGAAGAAMTLRLNDAQAALLDPTLRARLDSQLSAASAAYSYASSSHASSSHASSAGSDHAGSNYSGSRYSGSPRSSFTAPPSAAAPVTHSPAWFVAFAVAAAVIVVVTVIVLAFSYSGAIALLSVRTIPAYVIAVAWLVAGLSNPPKFFVAILGFGAALWPLIGLHVGPFSVLSDAVPPVIWMLLTVLATSVLVLRLAASRISPRRRAPRRHSNA